MFWTGLSQRWRAICSTRRDRYRAPEPILAAHRLVMQHFPDTPWVAEGVWSWCSGAPDQPNRRIPMVYPYLPLVLLWKEDDPLIPQAESAGVAYHVLTRPLEELEGKLARLRETALAIIR